MARFKRYRKNQYFSGTA